MEFLRRIFFYYTHQPLMFFLDYNRAQCIFPSAPGHPPPQITPPPHFQMSMRKYVGVNGLSGTPYKTPYKITLFPGFFFLAQSSSFRSGLQPHTPGMKFYLEYDEMN